ncbi:hypothetical protein JCM8202_003446 [Rhodotorula sphaerocarpa]
MDAGSLVLLVTAFALLLPLLPFALYRLARPFSLVNNTPLRLLAASTLVVDLFLALYATCALVALSGKAASTTVAVAAGAFTCLVTLVRDAIFMALARTTQPPPTRSAGSRLQFHRFSPALLLFLLLVAFSLHVALVAVTSSKATIRALSGARAAVSVVFSHVAVIDVLLQAKPRQEASNAKIDVETGRTDRPGTMSGRIGRVGLSDLSRMQLLSALALSVLLDILSVAFPFEAAYPQLTFSGSNRISALAPNLLGTTTDVPEAYLVISIAAAAQMVLLVEAVRVDI